MWFVNYESKKGRENNKKRGWEETWDGAFNCFEWGLNLLGIGVWDLVSRTNRSLLWA